MDQKLFEQLLSENATWFRPSNLNEMQKKPRRRLAKSLEQNQGEFTDDISTDMDHSDTEDQSLVKDGVNQTYPPVVVSVTRQATICDDCGRHCAQGREKEKKLYITQKPHWRERCVTCRRQRNPKTGQFDLTDRVAAGVYARWLRKNDQNHCDFDLEE